MTRPDGAIVNDDDDFPTFSDELDTVYDSIEALEDETRSALRDALNLARSPGFSFTWSELHRAGDTARAMQRMLDEHQHDIREVDYRAYRGFLRSVAATTALARALTPREAERVRARSSLLIDAARNRQALSAGVIRACLHLLMLSRHNRAYWDFARDVSLAVDALDDGPGVADLRRATRCLIPPRIFKDYTAYATPPRGANRTDRVRSVTLAGAPGLGKGA